jgi:hypothetical protein
MLHDRGIREPLGQLFSESELQALSLKDNYAAIITLSERLMVNVVVTINNTSYEYVYEGGASASAPLRLEYNCDEHHEEECLRVLWWASCLDYFA